MSPRHVGFSGTQLGMTESQLKTVSWLIRTQADIVHHGDCIGADAQVDSIANELGLIVVIHPPLDMKKRAFCESPYMREPKSYLARNQDIVEAVELLIAAPRGFREMRRSGTWATTRAAARARVATIIAWPNGGLGRIDYDRKEDE